MSTSEFTSAAHLASAENEASAVAPSPRAVGHTGMIVTVEHLAYIAIALLALLLHVWALGDRALHHDETLHASYSWYIYVGRGYIHDPLLHGPFLYHFGALMYFLFGDNDFTARLGVALFGTVLTVLPFLVRRELGRGAALLASLYLLISPAYLYMGRLLRHDMYSVVFEMLVFVAIVRYATTRQARWLYIGAAAFGLMYANQETSYLYVLMMGTPLVLLLLWRVYRPGIALVGALGVALAALVFVLPGEAQVDRSHTAVRIPETNDIIVEDPGPIFGWGPLETEDNAYALRIRNRPDSYAGMSVLQNVVGYFADLWKFFRHPAILSGIALLLACMAALVWLMWFRRDAEGLTAWQRALERDRVVVPVYASLSDGQRWLIALVIFLTIYIVLFTAFFTNAIGVISGTTGSLLYWLAQHNVQRGSQPAYYYLVLLVVYEPLLMLWGGAGLLLVIGGALRRLLHTLRARNADADDVPAPPWAPGLLPLLLVWWTLTSLGIYSWAGEKMPWLTIHVALPLVLLAAWTLQQVARWAFARVSLAESRLSFAAFGGAFIVVNGLGFVSMTRYINTGGTMERNGMLVVLLVVVMGGLIAAALGLLFNWRPLQRIISLAVALLGSLCLIYLSLSAQVTPAHILLIMLVLLVALALAATMRQGWRWTLGALAVWISLSGGLYMVRSAYRLAFQLGDTPREMLIYTQTSPDVMQVVRGLEEISLMRTGGLDMPIIYDNETVWNWYLRDFPNATSNGGTLDGPPPDEVQAVVMLYENIVSDPQARDNLSEFRIQRLPLRWWFPENEIYLKTDAWRSDELDNLSLLSRTLRAPFDEETMVQLWEFLFFRDPGAPLGSTDFIIAVRPQLADHIAPGLGAE